MLFKIIGILQGRHCTVASSGLGVELDPVPPAEKDPEEYVEVLP